MPGVSLSSLEVESTFRGALCGPICQSSSSSLRSEHQAQPLRQAHRLPAAAAAPVLQGAGVRTEAVGEAAAMAAESAATRHSAADFPTAAVSVQRTSAGARSRKRSATTPPTTPSPPESHRTRRIILEILTTTIKGFGEETIRIN